MKYLRIASKVMSQRASKVDHDQDSFITGLDENELTAYHELTEIMTNKEYWTTHETAHYRLTPEVAHKEAMGIIQRYRDNQREKKRHAKAS